MAATAAASTSQQATASTSSTNQVVTEYVVRVPKATKKKFNVMRFMSSSTVDVTKWTSVKMERENNLRERQEEEMPVFGAGSEFGREQKEEARRKKYGMTSKNYKPDDQPWILKPAGKTGKKYKGIRGGGITENASYYVFTQAADGAFDAYPIQEWYNFTPIQRYKALSAEEAEEEFGRREKVMNYFSIMLRKRLTLDERVGEPIDGEEKTAEFKKGKKKAKSDLKLTDMDEWLSDSEHDDSDSDDNDKSGDEAKGDKKKDKKGKKGGKGGKGGKGAKGGKQKAKKKKDKGSDDEALEESDEGDFDDREVDYMSDSSSSAEDDEKEEKMNKQMKGVEDEEALKNGSEEEEDEEALEEAEEEERKKNEEEKQRIKDNANAAVNSKDGEGNKDGGGDNKASGSGSGSMMGDDKKNMDGMGASGGAGGSKGKSKGDKKGNSSGESSAESSDSDFDDSKFQSAMFMQKAKKRGGSDNSAGSSRANTPTSKANGKSSKRKQLSESALVGNNGGNNNPSPMGAPASKKSKLESETKQLNALIGSPSEGISEDAVRRYLMRKPMTTTELLQKFRSKRTGISGDQLVTTIAQILKKLNPEKQTIKGKLYLSIKA